MEESATGITALKVIATGDFAKQNTGFYGEKGVGEVM